MSTGKNSKNGESSVTRVKSQRSLYGGERRYRSLFENMIDGYAHCRMLYDDHGVPDDFLYLYVNPAFERLTGLSDVTGKRVSEVIPGLRESNPELFDLYGRAAQRGERSRFETYVEALDIWFSIAVYSPRKHHFVAVFEDITERVHMQEKLRLTQVSVDRAADLIHWIAPDGRLLYVSDSNCRRHGYSREELLEMSIFDLDPTRTPSAWPAHWEEVRQRGSITFETVHATKQGELFPVEVTTNFVEHAGKQYNIAYARDISDRRRLEQSLRLTQLSLDRSTDYIFWIGPDGRLVYANESTCRRLGYEHAEALALTVFDIDPQAPRPWADHWNELKARGSLTFETVHMTKAGEVFPVEVTASYVEFDGQQYDFGLARDISERKVAEAELLEAKEAAERANEELLKTQQILELQARTDALTGAKNRRAILERLREEMARAERYGTSLAVAMIDIDHFKDVNDTYGHSVGDEVLREVVARMVQALRPYDGLGRFGGEEFLVILPQTSRSQVERALDRLRTAICSSPIELGGHNVNIAVSIGVGLDCSRRLDDAIRSADAALYRAKAEGRNRIAVGVCADC
jgi:diguanylate cyclase (GGDEF)-like protein/PAS domain S-box-containing protein